MTIFIQDQDSENAINSLNRQGISVTRLPSTGGFLQK
ncbi:MAG: cyclic-di-AMP receptor, partial [Anaerolineales bacterium]|nr:cyclic-di-AMP receptor [Anaerolineales bacterium]